jgi:glycine cleavage system H lipoate-binding protein
MLTIGIALIFGTISGLKYRKEKREMVPVRSTFPRLLFNEDFVESPEGLYYDKTHTWAFMEKDGLVKVGIDDFLQHITGHLTRIKMKSPGERVRKGKHILSIIQEGKQLDIYAPISGTIKESNTTLTTNTSIINSSPYNEGWVYRIEPSNWLKEIQFMVMSNKYKDWLKSEFNRLKEFLQSHLRPETAQYAYVMQDGGELKDGILADLGPEAWEDFQTNFIDVS